MNNHLEIPEEVQAILDSIENVPTYLAELSMPEHPKLPQFDRKIRVTGIDAKSETEFVFFTYEQVLYDKETGERFNISLPKPDWIVLKDTWSYLRDGQNQVVELPLKPELITLDNPVETLNLDFKVKVPSYKYMIWLMKNDKAGLLQLIEGYLSSFKEAKIDELNA